jgi:two-component system nitrate/nitrite response regulator NarL
MLREGLKHILSSTRFKVHPEDLASRDLRLTHILGSDALLFIVDTNLFLSGLADTVRALKEQYGNARIVALADEFDLNGMMSAFHAGADGYCLATTGYEALIKYLELVMLGEVVFPSTMFLSAMTALSRKVDSHEECASPREPLMLQMTPDDSSNAPVRSLSSREAEILQCLMQGAPNKVIARKLEVAEATVKVHIKAILRKIRVANRTQAAMWAVNHLPATSGDQIWLQSSNNLPIQPTFGQNIR